ncbi:MAG: multiprotein bridging factor aMBF1 [Thermoplasmata archaeon]|nr:multiprotein bridging factor aMBF1 [Thermoplasmata archaeon]
MLCEMCGTEVESTNRVKIEGSVLSVCPSCARFGVAIDPPATPAPVSDTAFQPTRPVTGASVPVSMGDRLSAGRRRLEERDLYRELPEMELAPDWMKRIRAAREKLAWTPEELAKKLNEKKSVVLKMESAGFRPPDAMIRKIEHLLKIRLRAEPEAATAAAGN